MRQARRRLVASYGRQMTLIRAGVGDLAIRGAMTSYAPDQVLGDVRQGDALINTTNDEIAAAAWPAPPRARDQMVIDGRTWAVQGAWPVYTGATLAGWKLWIRGGQT